MAANDILVEVRRGGRVESVHRGTFCLADADGTVRAAAGDIDTPVFPRSAVKSIQALAMFRSGAVDRFGLDDELLAVACGSHRGEPKQIETVHRFLSTIGLSAGDLECGVHPPADPDARQALRVAGETPSAVHNNCSGKHAGMLATALALGVETKGYTRPEHRVQVLVREGLETVLGAAIGSDVCGIDGCSVPTWASPLTALATGLARLATGKNLPDADAAAAKRLIGAATSHPDLVSGIGRFDTDAMVAFGGRLMLKAGAEGVYCGALGDLGIGFALKIDDGAMRAAETVAASLLIAAGKPDPAARRFLAPRAAASLRNWRGLEVGEIRATGIARPAL